MKEVIILGTIRKGCELGYSRGKNNYIWHACVDCGKERWVEFRNKKPFCSRCQLCSLRYFYKTHTGENNQNWKGGTTVTTKGYKEVRLFPDDFYYSMVGSQEYVPEHRLIMARHLGRCLQPWEIIHHKNGIRTDNRLENLQLVLKGRHNGKVRCPFCSKEFGLV